MEVKILKIRLDEKFLSDDQKKLDRFLASHNIKKFESAFCRRDESWSVILYFESEAVQENGKEIPTPSHLDVHEEKILNSLKFWRSEKAKTKKIPAYFIATNKELYSIVRNKPQKKEELKTIEGFGKHKIENFGEEIISLISKGH